MKHFKRITVQSFFPEEMKQLQDFSYNLWWSWRPKAQKLFHELDQKLWYEVEHNPLKMFKYISQAQLNEKNNDPEFSALLSEVMDEYKNYMTREDTWFNKQYPDSKDFQVAYFSAEFGIHETVPVYSGGLGILAGDHCKSASDLGIPLIGVGMMYKQGYFIQRFDEEGRQENIHPIYDFGEIPITLVKNDEDLPIKISINLPGRKVYAQIWQMTAGRTNIYLLDTDIQENLPEDRILTSQLYGGDSEMRLTQELLLGIGGVRAIRALGYKPTVWHMNEGHSSFMVLERIKEFIEKGYSFDLAKELVSSSSVFTTHTPVAAGHDAFDEPLMQKYFEECYHKYALEWRNFFNLGKDVNTNFSMTMLAMNMAKSINGVSKLHGEVSREMWQDLWKDIPVDEIPITSITNGVHTETWMSREFRELYDEYMVKDWLDKLDDSEMWKDIEVIPSRRVWETHLHRKARLVDIVKTRLEERNKRNGVAPHLTENMCRFLNPDTLFIGFARRFATYKRATLIFRDLERLKKLLSNSNRPVVFFFAGKAHPADRPGQEFIKEIYRLSYSEDFIGKIILLENYNMNLARYLVSGVDIWLNNPRRPREASGTSGEKVPINGGINFSVLDGWWEEGYNKKNGWTIGEAKDYANLDIQDNEDSSSMYYTLEKMILPEYYDRNDDNIPEAWVQRMKESIKSVLPRYSTARMVKDYVNKLYIPTFQYSEKMTAKDNKAVKDLVKWKKNIDKAWPEVWVTEMTPVEEFLNENHLNLSVEIQLGKLKPADVKVEVYVIKDSSINSNPVAIQELDMQSGKTKNRYMYAANVELPKAGSYQYGIRVRPFHPDLYKAFETRQIRWMEIEEMNS